MKPPYVHEWQDGTRFRRRYRRGGFARSLPGHLPFHSPAFMAAYAAADAAFAAQASTAPAGRVAAGSVDAHASRYMAGHAWAALADNTRKARSNLLRRFCDLRVPSGARVGGLPLAVMEEGHLRGLIADLPPQTKRMMVQALRQMIEAAVERGEMTRNVAGSIRVKVGKVKGRHTWTADEISTYRAHWGVGTIQRTAFDLLLLTGQRRGDAVLMGWNLVRDRVITIVQGKTGATARVPILQELAAVVDVLPIGAPWMTKVNGDPWRNGGSFGSAFAAWCAAAGLSAECRAHGLRKAFCCFWAERGHSVHQIAAMSGHLTLAEVERYTRAADREAIVRAMLAEGA
jgi:integrase